MVDVMSILLRDSDVKFVQDATQKILMKQTLKESEREGLWPLIWNTERLLRKYQNQLDESDESKIVQSKDYDKEYKKDQEDLRIVQKFFGLRYPNNDDSEQCITESNFPSDYRPEEIVKMIALFLQTPDKPVQPAPKESVTAEDKKKALEEKSAEAPPTLELKTVTQTEINKFTKKIKDIESEAGFLNNLWTFYKEQTEELVGHKTRNEKFEKVTLWTISYLVQPRLGKFLSSILLTPAQQSGFARFTQNLRSTAAAVYSRTSSLLEYLPWSSGGSSNEFKSGGMLTAKFKQNLFILRSQLRKMLDAQKKWLNQCGGSLDVPNEDPKLLITGREATCARVAESFVLPIIQPALFSIKRHHVLYGPEGSGKTFLLRNILYRMGTSLKYSQRMEEDANKAQDRKNNTKIEDYLVVYRMDFKSLLKENKMTESRLRSLLTDFLNCLDMDMRTKELFDPVRYVSTEQKQNILQTYGLLILENPDSIFYESKKETEAQIATGYNSSRSDLMQVFSSVFDEENFKLRYPNIRVLWNVRYIWKFDPDFMGSKSSMIPLDCQTYVDLPNMELRREIVQQFVKRNLKETMTALVRANVAPADNDWDDPVSKKIKEELKKNPIKSATDETKKKTYLEGGDYIKFEAEILQILEKEINLIAQVTGLGAQGICELTRVFPDASKLRLIFQMLGKSEDELTKTSGELVTKYGCSVNELGKFLEMYKSNQSRFYLKKIMDSEQAFVLGVPELSCIQCRPLSQEYASFLLPTASETNLKAKITANSTIYNDSKTTPEQKKNLCRKAYKPDLYDLSDPSQSISLIDRFCGFHLNFPVIKSTLEQWVKVLPPRPDYPCFVSYLIYLNPRVRDPNFTSNQCSIYDRDLRVADYYSTENSFESPKEKEFSPVIQTIFSFTPTANALRLGGSQKEFKNSFQQSLRMFYHCYRSS